MKPRLYLTFGYVWECRHPGTYIGFGYTPKEAYNDWVKHNHLKGKL